MFQVSRQDGRPLGSPQLARLQGLGRAGSPPHSLKCRAESRKLKTSTRSPQGPRPAPCRRLLRERRHVACHVCLVLGHFTCAQIHTSTGSRCPRSPSCDLHLKNILDVESQGRRPLRWALLTQDPPTCPLVASSLAGGHATEGRRWVPVCGDYPQGSPERCRGHSLLRPRAPLG